MALRGTEGEPLETQRLQWIQSICEQLGDGYLAFSGWQCIGFGGRLWRPAESGSLDRENADEWLGVFHEKDQGVVALGLADPAVNTFPEVRVWDRRASNYRKARLRLFLPPFGESDGFFVVVAQLTDEAIAEVAPETGGNTTEKDSVFAEVFSATSAEMLILDGRNGLVRKVNEAFLAANHLRAEEVEGRSFETLGVIDEEVAGILLGTLALGGKLRRRPMVLTPDGEEAREMLVDGAELPGAEACWVLSFTDVTLHNSATRHLSSLLNNLPVGIFTKCPKSGRYLLSNVTADTLLGQGESLRGKHDTELFPPDIGEDFAWADACVVREGRCIENPEVSLTAKNGDSRLYHILRVPLKDSRGEVNRVLGMVREVTDEVQAREALRRAKDLADRANRAKDEFLVNVGHEIRTPMNAVLGFVNLLRDTSLDPEQEELLEEVETSSEGLRRIFEQILELSEIAGGAISIEKVVFDFEQLCEELLESHAPRAYAKDLEMVLSVDPQVPARLKGDPQHLRSLLEPLVENAVKFTTEGKVMLKVDALEQKAGFARMRVAVIDTGIGIPADKQHRIFEPFVQADSSETRCYEGTGLGLTLSQRLAEMMGSRIVLESFEGRGSTFRLDLLLETDGKSRVGDALPAPELGGPLLVMGGSPAQSQHLAAQLSDWGLQCKVAPDPQAFLEELSGPQPAPYALFAWNALDGDEQAKFLRCAAEYCRHDRWIPVVLDPEEAACLAAEVPGLRVIESVLRFSHVRSALIDATGDKATEDVAATATEVADLALALAEKLEAASRPARAPAFEDHRILLIDDEGTHRRLLVKMMRDAGLTVDACDSEHQAIQFAELYSYDAVFFETNFLGDETARMVSGLKALTAQSAAPIFFGLAYLKSVRREEELRAIGVVEFLAKPIEWETVERCLKDHWTE